MSEQEGQNIQKTEVPSLGLGALVGSGLKTLAKLAEKLDEKREVPVAFTQKERLELFATFKAMNAAIDENQQRIKNLEDKLSRYETVLTAPPKVSIRKTPAGPGASPPPSEPHLPVVEDENTGWPLDPV